MAAVTAAMPARVAIPVTMSSVTLSWRRRWFAWAGTAAVAVSRAAAAAPVMNFETAFMATLLSNDSPHKTLGAMRSFYRKRPDLPLNRDVGLCSALRGG